jgi:transcriptional regulator with XRE-family HTH domain
MVNTEDFILRLKKIISHNELSASGFAEKLSVQRATISHLLSGRNKPSLDFVMKVTNVYDDVDLYWLLHGKGSYPKEELQHHRSTAENVTPPLKENHNLFTDDSIDESETEKITTPYKTAQQEQMANSAQITNNASGIKKVLILYQDGTFDVFEN